jgi:hypothetical protein
MASMSAQRWPAFSMPLSVVGRRKNGKVTIMGDYGARGDAVI